MSDQNQNEVFAATIPIKSRMKNVDLLIYEVQDMILTMYYENERDGKPLKESDISVLLGVSMSMVSKKIKEIKEKIKDNTDEKTANLLVSSLTQ